MNQTGAAALWKSMPCIGEVYFNSLLSARNRYLQARHVDRFNRQLHPDERQWAKNRAKDFAKFYEDKTGQKITAEQAQNMLLADGYRLVDAAVSKGPGGDQVAVAYISGNAGGLFQKDQ
ncbi:protein of unknown function [Burkholderia multivorans]